MDKHIIHHNDSILKALHMLNGLSGNAMTLFVLSDDERLVGTLTDGDIRRGLLAGAQPNDAAEKVMQRNFSYVSDSKIDVELFRDIRRRGIRLIPAVDSEMHITRIFDTGKTHSRLPLNAILMAGGKGERLRPMTLTTPKPLLEIGGMPIIDHNIRLLVQAGITSVFVTVNYLAEQLEAHFTRPVAGINVQCVREPMMLGTIGSAGLVPLPEEGNTIVMNSDLLTDVSFEEMYITHRSERADITIAAIPYNVSVPYAILTTQGSKVVALEEKPSYAYYANAGIYIISNELLHSIPAGKRVDATDLIEKAISDGKKVAYFPISGTWIDIGSPADFKHACELTQHRLGYKL